MFPTQFTGPSFTWERKKLGDVAEKVIQKNNNNAFKNVLTNSAEYGIISQRDFFERNIANKNNISTYYIVQNDDFVYNPRISNLAPYGPINRNKTGYTGIISPLYYVFRVLNINTAFIEWYFKTTCWHKFMYQHGDSGARSDRFSIKDNELKKLPIKLPADDMEQEKIAKTLTSLDNTLQLHERKCEELALIKKALLQKLFPKKDEFKPEVRYKNFSDAWEQRKLGEVTEYIKGFAFKSKDYKKSGHRIIRVSDLGKDSIINNNDSIFVTDEISKQQNKYKINKNEIIITTVGSKAELKESAVGRPIIVRNSLGYLLNQNLVKIHGKNNKDSRFIYYQLLQPRYSQYIATIQRGNANQANIAISDLWNYRIFITKHNEQQKIGNFFQQLDFLITLHQRKLEKLKQLKKFLLQNMFI